MEQLSQAMSEIERATNIDDDDTILRFVAAKRKSIVQTLAPGYDLPEDPKDRKLLVTVLADLSNTAMSRIKLGAAEKQSNLDREAQVLIAAMNASLQGRSPFEVSEEVIEGSVVNPTATREIPRLTFTDEEIAHFPDTVKERGVSMERFDDFTARMEPIMEEKRRQAARDAGLEDE